jgi:hypothetical protein
MPSYKVSRLALPVAPRGAFSALGEDTTMKLLRCLQFT